MACETQGSRATFATRNMTLHKLFDAIVAPHACYSIILILLDPAVCLVTSKGLPRRAAAKDDSRSGVVLNIQALPDTECWCGISSVVGSDATALLHKRIKRRRSSAGSSSDASDSASESGRSSVSVSTGIGQLTPPLNGSEIAAPVPLAATDMESESVAARRSKHSRTDSKLGGIEAGGQLTPPGSVPSSPKSAGMMLLRFPSRSSNSARRSL